MLKKRNAFKGRTPPFPPLRRKNNKFSEKREKEQQIQCAKWQLK